MTSSPRKRRQSGQKVNPSPKTPEKQGSPRQVMYLSPPNPGSNYRSRERKKPQEPKCEQLQNILDNLPSPARQYRVSRSVKKKEASEKCETSQKWPEEIAIKHIIQTSSAERTLTEIACLRMAAGKHNVISLLFCHRIDDNVVLGMPLMKLNKFADCMPGFTYQQMLCYTRHLLEALRHIHSLNIIHRDIKPANFLFDFESDKFLLIDFGLAQFMDEVSPPKPNPPEMKESRSNKRKSAPSKISLPTTPTKRREMQNQEEITPPSRKKSKPNSSKRDQSQQQPQQETGEQSLGNQHVKRKLSSNLCEGDAPEEKQIFMPESKVRRSPRKHEASISRLNSTQNRRDSTGFSKLTISRSTILDTGGNAMRRSPSFTMLDPTSGVPSTSHLNASLTSRSFTPTTKQVKASQISLHQPFSFASPSVQDVTNLRCGCFGVGRVCDKCNGRPQLKPPRAGTPGFRPPEVLLKSTNQTVKVDMWATGVILLCMMSRTYPFFRAPDDITNLAEMMQVFGSEAIKVAADRMGKNFTHSEFCSGQNLKFLCRTLCDRSEHPNLTQISMCEDLVTDQSVGLLEKLLAIHPDDRISADEALNLELFKPK